MVAVVSLARPPAVIRLHPFTPHSFFFADSSFSALFAFFPRRPRKATPCEEDSAGYIVVLRCSRSTLPTPPFFKPFCDKSSPEEGDGLSDFNGGDGPRVIGRRYRSTVLFHLHPLQPPFSARFSRSSFSSSSSFLFSFFCSLSFLSLLIFPFFFLSFH